MLRMIEKGLKAFSVFVVAVALLLLSGCPPPQRSLQTADSDGGSSFAPNPQATDSKGPGSFYPDKVDTVTNQLIEEVETQTQDNDDDG